MNGGFPESRHAKELPPSETTDTALMTARRLVCSLPRLHSAHNSSGTARGEAPSTLAGTFMPHQKMRRGVEFNVIHLSDLHMGVTGQKWMWPTFKTIFFNDLKQQYEKTGPWDLVIFSGDLTESPRSL